MGRRQEALERMELIKSDRVEPLLAEISLSDVPVYTDRLQHGTVVGKIVVRMSRQREAKYSSFYTLNSS